MVNCQGCELAAEIGEIRAIVDRLEKTLLGNHQPGRCAEHDARISRLERWRSRITGALALLGILWVAAVTVFAAVVAERMRRG